LIPDLVPLPRKASRPELPAVRASVDLDFDDAGEQAHGSLDLDLPPDEPIPRRSLAPSNPSLHVETLPLAEAPLSAPSPSVPKPASAPRPNVPQSALDAPTGPRLTSGPPTALSVPSLAPVSPRPGLRAEAQAAHADGTKAGSAPPLRTQPEHAGPFRQRPLERPLLLRLVPGAALVAASVLLTVLDRVYAAATGEVFSLGPLHTSWLTVALLLGGLGWCARELLARG
jgi:hypothetical protein